MKAYHMMTNMLTGEITMEEVPDGMDPVEFMHQQMDNCPLCQEARARGEVPQTRTYPPTPHTPRYRFPRRPRWRTRKRVVAN